LYCNEQLWRLSCCPRCEIKFLHPIVDNVFLDFPHNTCTHSAAPVQKKLFIVHACPIIVITSAGKFKTAQTLLSPVDTMFISLIVTNFSPVLCQKDYRVLSLKMMSLQMLTFFRKTSFRFNVWKIDYRCLLSPEMYDFHAM
jgi:hypothetical protein